MINLEPDKVFKVRANSGYKKAKNSSKITDSHMADLDRSIRIKIAENEEFRAKSIELAMTEIMK
jgi:hypothetical protein